MKKKYLKNIFVLFCIILTLSLYTSCNSSDGVAIPATGSVNLAAEATSGAKANGTDSYTVAVQVLDTNGKPMLGKSVTFSASGNAGLITITSQVGSTNFDGKATCSVTDINSTNDTVNISASSGGVQSTESVTLTFTGVASGTNAASTLSLGLSQPLLKSDSSDITIITATVLDKNNAVIEGVTVTFSATSGQLSTSTVDTGANGEAQVTFESGNADKSNRTATITATAAGLSRQIPVQITGTTITLVTSNTNLEIGGDDTATLTIKARDAGLVPIYDAEVTLSVDPAGAATLSLSKGNTNLHGELEVEVTGTQKGDVTVKVEALGAAATQIYSVGAIGDVFGIIPPDSYSMATNSDLTIKVRAPGLTHQVRFATTIGEWDGSDSVVIKSVVVDEVSAVLRSDVAGVATVQVNDEDDWSTTDSIKVVIYAPASEAAQITLQPSATIVAPSTGDSDNTVTLKATVRNSSDQPVGGAPVAFSIENPIGGGETVSPVLVYTDDFGVAISTFTSGSLSSGAAVEDAVRIIARVVGKPLIVDEVPIVIGGTAGSVVIGRSTTIKSSETDTAYILPMSVLVADSNGNAVSGAVVSLSTWPARYRTGHWEEVLLIVEVVRCVPVVTGSYENEDKNRNLILDPGEDTGPDPGHGDGELTPHNSTSGSVPATVTTDENGVANFDFIYLKEYAVWIEAEIKASTLVLGTETTSTHTFFLPFLNIDAENCVLHDSRFN